MTTLADWKTAATQALMDVLPGHEYTGAKTIVEAYLLAEGGWDPADVGEPEGDGEPVNGDTPTEAAAAIAEDRLSQVVTATMTVPLSVDVQSVGLFAEATSDEDVIAALSTEAQAAIEAALADVGPAVFSWGDATVERREGGSLDADGKTDVQATIEAVGLDPAAVATAWCRNAFGLDDTWMAFTVYRPANDSSSSYVVVRKHSSGAYTLVDEEAAVKYVVAMASGNVRSVSTVDV